MSAAIGQTLIVERELLRLPPVNTAYGEGWCDRGNPFRRHRHLRAISGGASGRLALDGESND